MRNFVEMADQLFMVIPNTEIALISGIRELREKAVSIPIEEQEHFWQEVAALFATYIGMPNTAWHFQVATVYAGKSTKEVEEYFEPLGKMLKDLEESILCRVEGRKRNSATPNDQSGSHLN